MRLNKKTLTLLAIPVALGGWALFRPELLFVNKTINESLPTSGTTTGTTIQIATGKFMSLAHETTGTAEIVELDGKQYLQLKNFHTSNGPDVRIYLTGGGSPDGKSLSLGTLKGNVGNQNYLLPDGYDGNIHTAVSIWCERFAVGFGLAELSQTQQEAAQTATQYRINSAEPQHQLVSLTRVTFGTATGSKEFTGSGALLEEDGKRWAELKFEKWTSGHQARLFKKESLKAGAIPDAESVNLQMPKLLKGAYISKTGLDKKIDLWLFRSIGIIDPKSKKIVSWINLRSEQENEKQVKTSLLS